ncbi:MAG TPA: hypothetical protein VF167_01075, partial [Longimicrobiaceae bacterium]
LAIAVVGGLSVSMLLTLFVVPCTYVILQRAGDRWKAWITGRAPVPATAASHPQQVEVPAGGD